MTFYTISSGVTSEGITLHMGDEMIVQSGGTATAIIVSGGGQDDIQFGGVGSAIQIRGGQEFVLAGGRVVGNVISAAGVLYQAGTGSATTVSSGGTEILSGGTTTAAVVKPGGLELVVFGTASATTVSSGGAQIILPRGTAKNTVTVAGSEVFSSGVELFNSTVLVSAFASSISGLTVGVGGTAFVLPHGAAEVAHVVSGGIVNVYSGGTASGVQVSAGGFEQVSSGGLAFATVVNGGGQLIVYSGGVASSTVMTNGDALISSGGTVVSTTMSGGTLFDVGLASATTVIGGIAYFEPGAQASATVVKSGGHENLIGGSANLTVVSSGGFQTVSSGSVANGTTVSSGGLQTVFGSGTADATNLVAGGSAIISGGGVASGMVVTGGLVSAVQSVTAGGTANATVVRSGGFQYVSSGVANGTMVSSGGLETVPDGGVASATTLSVSGGQIVSGSGLASNTVISGGFQTLTGGGSAIGTVIGDGGIERVFAGGSANLTVVNSGGTQVLSSGGVASATQLNSGGTIDLASLPFSAGAWADLSPSDVLTVIAGGSGYQQQLIGTYSGEFFQVGADTGSGLVVTITTTPQTPPARTLQWIGPQSAGFATPSDWNDVTEGFDPSLVSPHSNDTAEFLSGGGTITGSATVATLAFAGAAVWQVPAGGSLSATTGMTVGQSGVGSLLVNGGAAVDGLGDADVIGGTTGKAASVTVDGAGSTWESAGALNIGDPGAGSLTVSNQGTVQTGVDQAVYPAGGIGLGENSAASGEVTVTGANSLLSNTGHFVVGDLGLGGLSIDAGATVVTTPGTVVALAGLVIANTASASGSSVNVVGGNLQVTGALVDGNAGAGLLDIGPGGSVSADVMDLGLGANSVGVLTLAGAGASLTTTGSLVVGAAGAGELSILGGASVTIGGDLDIGTASGSSGNVDVENTTGTLIIDGNLNVGVGGGVATMTIGLGTGVQLDNGGINQGKFSKLIEHTGFDPQFENTNGGGLELASGINTFLAYFNNNLAGQVTQDASGDQSVLQVPTIYASSGSGSFQINSGDSALTLNADGVSGQTFQFTDNTGTLVIGIDQLKTIDVPASGTGPFTAEANPNLGLHLIGGFGGTIASMVAGDAIVVDTTAAAHISYPGSGTVVSVIDNASGTQVGTLAFASAALAAEISVGSVSASQLELVACFAAGTRIATLNGWVKVEELRVGDVVRTVSERNGSNGDVADFIRAAAPCEPIVWIGSRALNCARHRRPETVWPVRISAGAFGENVPVRDLFLSPDHAVFVNGVLVPVKLLVNGGSVTQVKRNHVTYYHVELPEHAVILAEGLTVESYLDAGDRTNFNGSGTVRMFPDFAVRLASETALLWETRGAAPLVMAGEQLTMARDVVMRNEPTRRSRLPRRIPAGFPSRRCRVPQGVKPTTHMIVRCVNL